jgi:prepilin-type N-terminal cleavage/methylation domain-containing protein
MKQHRYGLTLVEVIVAIAMLAIVLAAFSSGAISNIKQNASSGSRTAAVRLIDYLGRLATEGDSTILPVANTTVRNWNYGGLSSLPGLSSEAGLANPALYKASVTSSTVPAWSTSLGVGMRSYTLSVCWKNSGSEPCIQAVGVGPDNTLPTGNPPADVN